MEPKYLAFNGGIAFVWFFLNGKLGKLLYDSSPDLFAYSAFSFRPREERSFSGNFFLKIVNPAVYLALSSAFAQRVMPEGYAASLWLFVLAFWLIRFFFMLLENSLVILNIKYEVQAFLFSVGLSEGIFFFIIKPLIDSGEDILISPSALRDALWVAVAAYVVKTIWDMLKRNYTADNLYPESKCYAIAMKRYEKFSKKYGAYIERTIADSPAGELDAGRQSQIIYLLYAVMIYEDYNRPWLRRMAEYAVKVVFKRHGEMSLGIMQIRSDRLLSDRESIGRAIDIICKPFLDDDPNAVSSAISSYNPDADYGSEVIALYEMLRNDPVGSVAEVLFS